MFQDLTPRERKWMKSMIPRPTKRLGFRTYTSSAAFKEVLADRMEKVAAEQRAHCATEGLDYIAVNPFAARERIKVEEWQKLSTEEQEQWREVAKLNSHDAETTE